MFNLFRKKSTPVKTSAVPDTHHECVLPRQASELSEALRLDIKELIGTLLKPGDHQLIWLYRRYSILVSMLPMLLFLESANYPYGPQDILDLDALDNLMLRTRNAFGHAALFVQQDLEKHLFNIPCYNSSTKGHQSIIAKQNYNFVVMCTRHLNATPHVHTV